MNNNRTIKWKKGDKKDKVEKAVLSITGKKNRRDAEKKTDKGEEKMEIVIIYA